MKNAAYYMALNYRKIVNKDDEGTFIVEVPELPGCAADGDSIEEAFANLNDAMEVWLESRLESGQDIPEPRGTETFSGKFVVRIPKRLHQVLAEQAEADNCSLNQYVVSLLSESVGRRSEEHRRASLEQVVVDVVQRLERVTGYASISQPVWTQPMILSLQEQEGSQLGAAQSFASTSKFALLDMPQRQEDMAYQA